MGTKNQPGRFDCYYAAEDDEPMFILLGRDEQAADRVEEWAVERMNKMVRQLASASPPDRDERLEIIRKIAEALDCARAMREYYKRRECASMGLLSPLSELARRAYAGPNLVDAGLVPRPAGKHPALAAPYTRHGGTPGPGNVGQPCCNDSPNCTNKECVYMRMAQGVTDPRYEVRGELTTTFENPAALERACRDRTDPEGGIPGRGDAPTSSGLDSAPGPFGLDLTAAPEDVNARAIEAGIDMVGDAHRSGHEFDQHEADRVRAQGSGHSFDIPDAVRAPIGRVARPCTGSCTGSCMSRGCNCEDTAMATAMESRCTRDHVCATVGQGPCNGLPRGAAR